LRTQILTAQRYSMGVSLLACLMTKCSNGPSLNQREEVEKFLLAVVVPFEAFLAPMSYPPQRPRCLLPARKVATPTKNPFGILQVQEDDE